MLPLKDYQQESLAALESYFKRCTHHEEAQTTAALTPANLAFQEVTAEVHRRPLQYQSVNEFLGERLPEMDGLPYVCLRVPTGGGKTLMACHAVGTATRDLMQAERAVVLWLVPSNAILEQTLAALKDRAHPYRQAVEASADGSVRVLDIEEALYVGRATLDTATTIIVSTMQAFRVEDTDGRRVYEPNGSLQDHFDHLPREALGGLERFEDGALKHSLANVLRLRRPAVIVDEAHNARSDLSFETLARFRPACILELTATPNREERPSNVLHSTSAAELKAEEMIKLPIELTTQEAWKELLGSAIEKRDALEEEAKAERRETGEYIRPVMLIKAEANRGTDPVTVDVVKQCLMEDFRIPEDEIAVETGRSDDLDGVDIESEDCPIRYVITVQKLAEGWDCPSAYVLCSVAAMRSNRAVEQITGRVLRMPQAKKKTRDALNRAYAFGADADFTSALGAMHDVLVESGFERQEAETLVQESNAQRERKKPAPEGLFAQGRSGGDDEDGASREVRVTVELDEAPDRDGFDGLDRETRNKVDLTGGTLTFRGSSMSEAERDDLKSCFSGAGTQEAIDEAHRKVQQQTSGRVKAPAEEGTPFEVPQLAIAYDGQYEAFGETHLLAGDWKLSGREATLPGYDGPRRAGERGAVDVSEEGQVQIRYIDRVQRQMTLLDEKRDWSVAALVRWLDRKIPHPHFTQQDVGVFLTSLIQDDLMESEGFALDELVRDKYRLRRFVEARIREHQHAARTEAHERLLDLEREPPVTVRPDVCFSFPEEYPCNRLYGNGRYEFQKHYYRKVGAFDSEEEEHCAAFIDRQEEVEYWVRNLTKPRFSFWLQTATDRFYPDFVCKLRDGRHFVVEYKGADRWGNPENTEKRNLGQLWEERSRGQCLFVMPEGPDHDAIRAKMR